MKKKLLILISLSLVLVISLSYFGVVQVKAETTALSINAKSSLLMDFSTGKIVHEQNSFERLPIASMVKIMTLLLCFEQIDSGNLSFDTKIIASANATSMGGSQAFLDTNAEYKTDELLKSIIVASANDSCVAMAEHISGSVDGFVTKMNEKSESLGLKDTYYVNCTGLPAANQYSCANDVAIMTRELIKHKDFFEFSKVWMFDFAHPSGRITQLTNTNKLIRAYEGCDGGKTGFTNEALSCLSATAKRGETRFISVVIGAKDSKTRNGEIAKLLNYGFANFETKQIVFKNQNLPDEIKVNGGKQKTITIKTNDDYFYFVKKGAKPDIKITTEINKLSAPIKQDDIIGKMIIEIDGQSVGEVSLSSNDDVKKISYMDIIDDMIMGW